MSKENEAVILSAARTAIGKFQGGLSSIPAAKLGAVAVKAAVERAGIDPNDIEEVLMGNVIQAGNGQAPARQAAIFAGLASHCRRDHRQQSLRLGLEGRHAFGASHPRWRCQFVRRRRDGVHEPRALSRQRAFGRTQVWQPTPHRRPAQRWSVGSF